MRVRSLSLSLAIAISGLVGAAGPSQAAAASAPVIVPQNLSNNMSGLGRESITVRFNKPADNGSPITSYDIWVSSDSLGATWDKKYTAAPADLNAATVIIAVPVPTGSARLVKVRARSADSDPATADVVGDWSASMEMFTKGARTMRVYVQTPDGTPVVGGVITWAMANGSARSSVTYGLTQSGYIDFPAAPAGDVNVTLTRGELPNGVQVSGTFAAVLGYSSTTLMTPASPNAVHTVTVKLPNGLPVANADVEVFSDDMSDTQVSSGFTFYIPNSGLLSVSPDASESDWIDDAEYWDYEEFDYWTDVDINVNINSLSSAKNTSKSVDSAKAAILAMNNSELVKSGVTNSMGRFTVLGFTRSVPDARVTYDDEVITQTQEVQLQSRNTVVELDYIPYVAVTDDSVNATENTAVTIPVLVADPSNVSSQLNSLNSDRSRSVGIRVKLVSPSGAPVYRNGSCRGLASSYVTGSNGRAAVKICATKSGNYRVVSLSGGTLSMGAVEILVKGAPSLPVRKLNGSSKTFGTMNLAWTAPKYTGGTKITGYKIKATAPGAPTINKTVTSTSLRLTGLKNGKRYTVSVIAVTKNGSSDQVKISVPVS
jgi:hypothetical protein